LKISLTQIDSFLYFYVDLDPASKKGPGGVVALSFPMPLEQQNPQEALPSPILNSASLALDMKRSLFKAKVNGLPTPSGPVITNSQYSSFSEPNGTSSFVSSSEAITKSLTHYLLQTYLNSNPHYNYQPVNNPRRVLTKPSKPLHNNGHDNENWDYILYVNDMLGAQEGHQYQILDLLGQGTFGQVVKCQNIKTKEFLAIKVIKNKPSYYNQSLVEVTMLEMVPLFNAVK
jgi:hypothetical protein